MRKRVEKEQNRTAIMKFNLKSEMYQSSLIAFYKNLQQMLLEAASFIITNLIKIARTIDSPHLNLQIPTFNPKTTHQRRKHERPTRIAP